LAVGMALGEVKYGPSIKHKSVPEVPATNPTKPEI